jgi:hypothetical protein
LRPAIENPKSKVENTRARVVELADTTVLEAVAERLAGSSPVLGIKSSATFKGGLAGL